MGIKKTLRMIAPPTWGTLNIYVGVRSFDSFVWSYLYNWHTRECDSL